MSWFDLFTYRGRLRGRCPECNSKNLNQSTDYLFCSDCEWVIKKIDCKIENKDTFFKERIIYVIEKPVGIV